MGGRVGRGRVIRPGQGREVEGEARGVGRVWPPVDEVVPPVGVSREVYPLNFMLHLHALHKRTLY